MKWIGFSAGIFSFWALALGCAPVYQIKYNYSPPESAEGRSCTQRCEATKIQCEQSVNKEVEAERLKSQQVYQTCHLSETEASQSPILCFDQSRWIQPDYFICLADYNRCFQGCGGKVEEGKVCISRCR